LSRLLPPGMDTEDEALADGTHNSADNDDKAYNEAMSRAAVGRLFDDGNDDPPPVTSAFVTGYDRAPTQADDSRPVARQDTRDWSQPDSGFQGRLVEPERPRARRDTVTARLIQGEEDPYEVGLRDGRAMRDRDRRRASNPDPRPAVRVNVPTERPIQEAHQAHDPRRPSREERNAAPTTDEDLDGFRQRFNPGELVSAPRNPNRPVRPGQQRDVRKDRMRVESRDMETVSPLRWILAAVVLAVLVLIVFLVIRIRSLTDYRDQVEAATAAQAAAESARDGYRADVSILENRVSQLEYELENMAALGQDNQDGRPGTQEAPPAPPSPLLPTTHTIVSGENLHAIARRFFPNVEVADAMQHIYLTNPIIVNMNDIQVGWVLDILPMN